MDKLLVSHTVHTRPTSYKLWSEIDRYYNVNIAGPSFARKGTLLAVYPMNSKMKFDRKKVRRPSKTSLVSSIL